MVDLISREVAAKILRARANMSVGTPKSVFYAAAGMIDKLPAVDAEPVITGETSDGYHTFNELYHHRAVLFSVIVKAFPERAWKARQHHDGTMYEGMFIVGIDTPYGQASYHYDIEPYWNMFACRELERSPEWDGHTPAQAIERIGRLVPVRHGQWELTQKDCIQCSECHEEWAIRDRGEFIEFEVQEDLKWCPSCGARMDAEENT